MKGNVSANPYRLNKFSVALDLRIADGEHYI